MCIRAKACGVDCGIPRELLSPFGQGFRSYVHSMASRQWWWGLPSCIQQEGWQVAGELSIAWYFKVCHLVFKPNNDIHQVSPIIFTNTTHVKFPIPHDRKFHPMHVQNKQLWRLMRFCRRPLLGSRRAAVRPNDPQRRMLMEMVLTQFRLRMMRKGVPKQSNAVKL